MNILQIKQDIDFLCGSTSGTYPDVDKIRNINIANQDVARVIWESDGNWSYIDSNGTEDSEAYHTLQHNIDTYTIPTTSLKINGVEVQDSAGNWMKLTPKPLYDYDISPKEYLDTAGMPLYYRLEGSNVVLTPAPSSGYATMASGMLVRISPQATDFTVTATTTVPGFATPFHRLLSYAASLDFTQDENERKFLIAQKARLENGMKNFYARRATEFKTAIKPSHRKQWRQYI